MPDCSMHYQTYIIETLSMMYGFRTMHLTCIIVNNFTSVNNRRQWKIITTQLVQVHGFLVFPFSFSLFVGFVTSNFFFSRSLSLSLLVSIRFPALVSGLDFLFSVVVFFSFFSFFRNTCFPSSSLRSNLLGHRRESNRRRLKFYSFTTSISRYTLRTHRYTLPVGLFI